MYDTDAGALAGPDFLDSVAEAERANGNDVNAAEYSRRAQQWRKDLRALENATNALTDVRRRTDPPLTRPGYALTPTDRR